MITRTYNRSYLQNLPERKKNEMIKTIIEGFSQDILDAAAKGKTFYLYDASKLDTKVIKGFIPKITVDDVVNGLKQKYADCDVIYQEIWIDITPTTRILRKDILIDWS